MPFIPVLLAVFPALMAVSASMDLVTLTIPNRIPLALLLGYAGLATVFGLPWTAVLTGVSCGAATLAATFLLFVFRLIGGGDAKLAAATALWLGWGSILDYAVAATLIGGALALAILAARATPFPAALYRQGWIARLLSPGTGVPYGIALAAAGLMEYPHSPVWTAALS
jgi:prepilin peptidase CpaA